MYTRVPISIVAILSALVLVAAVWDLRVRRIPNWLSLPGSVLGIGFNSFLFGWTGLEKSLEGMGIALAVYLLLYAIRAMGAGDVKLMAAVGALVGPMGWMAIFLITSMIGGVFALILVTSRGRLGRTLDNARFIFGEIAHLRPPYVTRAELSIKGEKAMTLPHGAIIALGCFTYLAWPFGQ